MVLYTFMSVLGLHPEALDSKEMSSWTLPVKLLLGMGTSNLWQLDPLLVFPGITLGTPCLGSHYKHHPDVF